MSRMPRRRRRRSLLRAALPVGIALSVTAAVSVSVGAIPGSDDVIDACYSANGTLRVIDTEKANPQKCGRRWKALSWNQRGIQGKTGARGPRGVQGPPGPAGLQGPKGDSGASRVTFAIFHYNNSIPDNSFAVNGDYKKIVSKRLPGGSYAIDATVGSFFVITGQGAGRYVMVHCEVRNGTNVIGFASERDTDSNFDVNPPSSGGAMSRFMAINGGAQVPAGGGEVSLWCRAEPLALIQHAQMMITEVGGFF